VYVGDIESANELALTRGGGEIINLGSSVGTSINEVFDLLKGITGYPLIRTHGPAKQGEVFRSYISQEKAASLLGWSPTVSLQDGLERTIAWFRP
jgi:UDP-glucose 4-epimerase